MACQDRRTLLIGQLLLLDRWWRSRRGEGTTRVAPCPGRLGICGGALCLCLSSRRRSRVFLPNWWELRWCGRCGQVDQSAAALLLLPVGNLEQDLVITQAQGALHLVDEFVLETLENEFVRATVEDCQGVLEQHFEVNPFTSV